MDITDIEKFRKVFLDDQDIKNRNLCEIYNDKHVDEAILLCTCYIEAMASRFYWADKKGSAENFVRIIQECCNDEIFSYISRRMLKEAFHELKVCRKDKKTGKSKWDAIYENISIMLQQADDKLYSEAEIVDLYSTSFDNSDLQSVRKELWRGSYAAIIYY